MRQMPWAVVETWEGGFRKGEANRHHFSVARIVYSTLCYYTGISRAESCSMRVSDQASRTSLDCVGLSGRIYQA